MKKELITPLSALRQLVECLDKSLVNLEDATEHFTNSVLSVEGLSTDELDTYTPKERHDILSLIENYTLMSSFLLDHPLVTVIRQIRDESKIKESDTTIMAIKHLIKPDQKYRHYKGGEYTVTSVAANANHPTIDNIHYIGSDGKTWELPIHEFSKRVVVDDSSVNRFTLIQA